MSKHTTWGDVMSKNISSSNKKSRKGYLNRRLAKKVVTSNIYTLSLEALESRAETIARQCHLTQKRKAGQPYINHVQAVAALCPRQEDKIVAWLHDTVEDDHITLDQLSKEFPRWVTEAVDALTIREGEVYSAYLQRVKANLIARRVKLADLTHNMSNLDRHSHQYGKYDLAYQFMLS